MIRKTFIEIIVIVICALSILIPGKLLVARSQNSVGIPSAVPERLYSAANMSMAKNASEKLKVEEKIQLIRGEWESNIYEGVENESSKHAVRIPSLAVGAMGNLFKEGLYPVDISTNYANWYSWKVSCNKVVDVVFNTYTVYYWIIEFEKYDRTEQHTVYMLEDGTIFEAVGHINGEEFNYTYEIEE